PHLAPCGAAGASEKTAASDRDGKASSAGSERSESGLGVRFRVRRVREWTDPEVPDGPGRVHARVPGDRCRWKHPFEPRDRGAVEAGERTRYTSIPPIRQRLGVHLESDPALAG